MAFIGAPLLGLAAGTAAATGIGATLVGATVAIGAGLGIAAAGKSLLTKPKTPDLQAPPAAPTFDEELEKAEEEARIRARRRTVTTLTPAEGLLDVKESSKKTLLGG